MRMDTYDIDMTILGAKSRSGKPKTKRNTQKGKKRAADYNYEGWADLRNAKGKKRKSSGKQGDSTKRKGTGTPTGRKPKGKAAAQETSRDKKARGQAAGKNRAGKRPKRISQDKGSKRPGYKSSGLRSKRNR